MNLLLRFITMSVAGFILYIALVLLIQRDLIRSAMQLSRTRAAPPEAMTGSTN